jgi:hypothetical protein
MQPSRSRSSIEPVVALAVAALAAAACSDDATCGPGAIGATGLTLTIGAETVTYGGFTASANNDCTIAGSAARVVITATSAVLSLSLNQTK